MKKDLVEKNQPKKPSRNGQVQIDLFKMALWSSWTWGQKNHTGGFFDQNSQSKKLRFLVVNQFYLPNTMSISQQHE